MSMPSRESFGSYDELSHFPYGMDLVEVDQRDLFGYNPLHRACRTGDLEMVEELIRQNADVHAETKRGRSTPLHLAAQHGHELVVRKLLDHLGPLDYSKANDDGDTPLHLAASGGNCNILRLLWDLLPPGSDPNLRNGKNLTPLHFAAGHGRLDAVKFLLHDLHAQRDACDLSGARPFHYWARGGHTLSNTTMKILTEDVDVKSNGGWTALHYASWNGHRKTVQWLLSKGASPKAREKKGNTPIHWAARNGYPDIIKTLLEKGADICATNDMRELPLDLVDEWKCESVILCLCGAFVNLESQKSCEIDLIYNLMVRNYEESTILHYVVAYAKNHDIEWIFTNIRRKIISNRGDDGDMSIVLNIKDKYGRTPMHWAARKGNNHFQVLQTLARSNVNLQAEDDERLTPLTHALIHQHLSFAEELITILGTRLDPKKWIENWDGNAKKTLKSDDRYLKLLSGIKEDLERFLPFVSEEDVFDVFDSMPPMWTALFIREEGIAKIMQKYNKHAVNQREDSTGRTALHWAIILQQEHVVVMLCRTREFEKEMLANVEDKFGRTALRYAIEIGNDDITKELMQTKSVQSWLDRLYQDRQVYVDAANAILVGAALIAGVTFAGWLQPPLGNTDEAYSTHIEVRAFWAFNSLSFFFAIATVLAAAGTIIPMSEDYIPRVVSIIRISLLYAAVLFAISILFVLGAFSAAGFAVLPSLLKYRANMMVTVAIGGVPCLGFLGWFFFRLYMLRPRWFRSLQTVILKCLIQNKDYHPVNHSSFKIDSYR